ncbi:hypothetical protein DITRI_Ditri14bG0088500 [Diplodiscus trichospermus]
MDTQKGVSEICFSEKDGDDYNTFRFVSAEACAMALSKAAEAVASGDSEVIDAVSEAWLIILLRPLEA